MSARQNSKNPYAPILAKSTIREKSVTRTDTADPRGVIAGFGTHPSTRPVTFQRWQFDP
jgi:hypothetical protein